MEVVPVRWIVPALIVSALAVFYATDKIDSMRELNAVRLEAQKRIDAVKLDNMKRINELDLKITDLSIKVYELKKCADDNSCPR